VDRAAFFTVSTAGRSRRLGVDGGHMVAGLDKAGEHGYREVGTAHEDQL
jgi:hypothetical protein